MCFKVLGLEFSCRNCTCPNFIDFDLYINGLGKVENIDVETWSGHISAFSHARETRVSITTCVI